MWPHPHGVGALPLPGALLSCGRLFPRLGSFINFSYTFVGSFFGSVKSSGIHDLHNDLIDAIKKDGITIDASNGKSRHLSEKITNHVPTISNYSHEFFNYNAGKQPGARTIRTGTQTERRILSAMLPHIQRLTPERP